MSEVFYKYITEKIVKITHDGRHLLRPKDELIQHPELGTAAFASVISENVVIQKIGNDTPVEEVAATEVLANE